MAGVNYTSFLAGLKSADDPIAQTFRVLPDYCAGADGCYITSVDLFFYQKDPTFGISVDIRPTEQGAPTRTILSGSKVNLDTAFINVSDDASAVTKVVFKTPVYVKAGRQYAVCISPHGASPNYRIWTAKQFREDISTGVTVAQNAWGDGAFFTSVSGAWLPKADTDLKFRLYRAQFSLGSPGTVTMVNEDYEFLTVSTTSGTFTPNEEIYKQPSSFATGNVQLTVGNSIVTGIGTTFTSFTEGQSIVVRNQANTSQADVLTIKSITNDTVLTTVEAPKIGFTAGKAAVVPTGIVQKYVTATSELILTNSTATNTSNRFEVGDVVVGTDSLAIATITGVDNKIVSYYQPHIYKTEPAATRVETSAKWTDAANAINTSTKSIIYGLNNKVSNFEAAIYSKSNEANSTSITKSLVVTSTLKTNNPSTAPALDAEISSVYAFKNHISANNTNEKLAQVGSANSKYISKLVTLSPGIEADDLEVYLTAYRPANTDIEVYARIINDADADAPNERQWTKLAEDSAQANLVSDSARTDDYKEFKYYIPLIPTVDDGNKQAGTANTQNGNNIVAIASANTYYEAGDIIVVGSGINNNYVISRVESANSTTVTMYEYSERTLTNTFHYKVYSDETRSAYRYPGISGTRELNYYDSVGRLYENFTKFQLKIVFLADQSRRVPKVKDIRAIALTA